MSPSGLRLVSVESRGGSVGLFWQAASIFAARHGSPGLSRGKPRATFVAFLNLALESDAFLGECLMSAAWRERKSRLNSLLAVDDDEDAQGLALDRILHGQSVIGKTCA